MVAVSGSVLLNASLSYWLLGVLAWHSCLPGDGKRPPSHRQPAFITCPSLIDARCRAVVDTDTHSASAHGEPAQTLLTQDPVTWMLLQHADMHHGQPLLRLQASWMPAPVAASRLPVFAASNTQASYGCLLCLTQPDASGHPPGSGVMIRTTNMPPAASVLSCPQTTCSRSCACNAEMPCTIKGGRGVCPRSLERELMLQSQSQLQQVSHACCH